MRSVSTVQQDGKAQILRTQLLRLKWRACLKRRPGRARGRQLMSSSAATHSCMGMQAHVHTCTHITCILHTRHHRQTHYTACAHTHAHTHTHTHTHTQSQTQQTNTPESTRTTNTQEKICKLIHTWTWLCRHDKTPHKRRQLK